MLWIKRLQDNRTTEYQKYESKKYHFNLSHQDTTDWYYLSQQCRQQWDWETDERQTNLIGSCCYWHRYSIFIPKSKSQPHILLLMLQGKCRGITVFYYRGSFQPKHWISNSSQVLRKCNLSATRFETNKILCKYSHQYIKKSMRVQSTSVSQYKPFTECIHHTAKSTPIHTQL